MYLPRSSISTFRAFTSRVAVSVPVTSPPVRIPRTVPPLTPCFARRALVVLLSTLSIRHSIVWILASPLFTTVIRILSAAIAIPFTAMISRRTVAISVPIVATISFSVPPLSVLVVVSMLAFVRAVSVLVRPAPVSVPVTVAVTMLRIATIFIFVSTLCVSGTRSVRVLAVW